MANMVKRPPVKKLTNTSEWRWSETAYEWQRLHPKEGVWVSDHRPLPIWLIEESGVVTDSRISQIWEDSDGFAELKKQLFWMSFAELKQRLDNLTTENQEKDGPIPTHSGNSKDGVIYDPMQAVLDSQRYREYEPQQQFQTSEGGRFRAKH